MITAAERIMLASEFSTLRTLWIYRARVQSGRIADERVWMVDNGFESVDTTETTLLLDDGREVLWVAGKSWVLRKELHMERLDNAMAHAKARFSPKVASAQEIKIESKASSCLALIGEQLCGGNLIQTGVCPGCSLGKSGVRATLTCDVCGHVTAVMREGKS